MYKMQLFVKIVVKWGMVAYLVESEREWVKSYRKLDSGSI
jgi:hypothetical protein